MSREVVERSLDTVLAITSHCDSRVSRSFRTRTRQEITTIAFQGLQFASALIAARSSAEALEEAFRTSDLKTFIDKICTDKDYSKKLGLEEPEKKAYAIYGYAILRILNDLGLIAQQTFADFIKSTAPKAVLQEFAVQIATWLKKFAEAYIKTTNME